MRFKERKVFEYDPEVFAQSDTQTALGIHEEWTVRCSPRPTPVFLEVDRRDQQFDPLWHTPVGPRTVYSREIAMPSLNIFERMKFLRTKFQITPKRVDNFLLTHNLLAKFDYFPMQGDAVFWNGYRYSIVDIALDPAGYWQQTNVWTGIYVVAIIPPEGDARPVSNPMARLPTEAPSLPKLGR